VDTDADRIFYIAQRAAKGKSLEDLVTGGWRVSEEKVILIALEVKIVICLEACCESPDIHIIILNCLNRVLTEAIMW